MGATMKSMIKKLSVVSVFGLSMAMMGGDQAEAATDTSDIVVSANVIAFCEIVANPLVFGNYDVTMGTDVTASASLAVDCTDGLDFDLSLEDGNSFGLGSLGAYGMAGQGAAAGSFLGYDLRFAGALIVPNTIFTSGTGDGYGGVGPGDQSFSIDGTIPTGQAVAGGSYTDTVTATLSF